MDYWRHQTGVGLNIVDKLLNYTILTPESVVGWALVDHVERGTVLSEAWLYEMIAGTVGKVTNRVRQIVAAIRRPGLPDEQAGLLKETLDREMGDMKSLFGMVEDAIVSFKDGNQDQMMESDGQSPGEEGLIKEWGARWMRVFQRQYAVEESWVREELAKPLPPPEPEPEVSRADVKMEMNQEQQQPQVNGQNGVGHELDVDGIE